MNLIAIETSTNCCSAALITATQELEVKTSNTRSQASLLTQMSDEILCEAGLSKHEIDCVAFGSGPGSFNGVRAAASFAHAVSVANKVPIIAVSTLRALAFASVTPKTKHVLSIIDARQNEVYYAAYSVESSNIFNILQTEHNLAKPEEIFVPKSADWMVAICNGDNFEPKLPPQIRNMARSTVTEPTALSVGKLARIAHNKNRHQTLSNAMPVYLRHPVKTKQIN
jgi:tRNA threonylcarbamoyladenosine biosynthesis protein TsaB